MSYSFPTLHMTRTRFFATVSITAATVFISVIPAFASDATLSTRGSKTSQKALDVSCIQAAVITRETSLDGGIATNNAAQTSAYLTRKNALSAAWTQTDATLRKTAIENAWSSFKTAKKSAAQQWKTTRDSAWKTFKIAIKTCGSDATLSAELSQGNSDQ